MSGTPQIRIRGLYKIFGPDDRAMLEHVRAGVTKTELLAEYRHVLGLQDINVDMRKGQTTGVMGVVGVGQVDADPPHQPAHRPDTRRSCSSPTISTRR